MLSVRCSLGLSLATHSPNSRVTRCLLLCGAVATGWSEVIFGRKDFLSQGTAFQGLGYLYTGQLEHLRQHFIICSNFKFLSNVFSKPYNRIRCNQRRRLTDTIAGSTPRTTFDLAATACNASIVSIVFWSASTVAATDAALAAAASWATKTVVTKCHKAINSNTTHTLTTQKVFVIQHLSPAVCTNMCAHTSKIPFCNGNICM